MATEIPLSFAELSNIAQIGGQMNIATEQLAGFTETVAKFVATADGATIDSSTQAFGRMANLFNSGMDADPEFFERIGSAISFTADNAVTSEAKITAMLDKIAPISAQFGLGAENVIAFASALSSVGLPPEISRGFITRFFGQLNKSVAVGSGLMDDYAQVLNLTGKEFAELYRSDPAEVLRRVAEEMSKLDSVQASSMMDRLGIKSTRDQAVLAGLSQSFDTLQDAITDVDEAYSKASYLDTSSEGIFSTLSANLVKLASAFSNLGDSVGSGIIPILSRFAEMLSFAVQGLADLADANPAVKTVLATLMSLGSAVGILFALRSAAAFFRAGMVTLTHITKQSAGGTMTFTAQVRNLAAAQLQAKGMTEAASAAYVKQVGVLRALGAASNLSTIEARALNVQMLSGGTANKSFRAGIKGAGSALIGFAGGPVGIAIGALGLLGSAWWSASTDAKASAGDCARF